MKFVVITPFKRYQNRNILTNHLRDFNIIWNPIVDDREWVLWYNSEDWIFPFVYKTEGLEGDQGNIRINKFIENGLEDETYYSFLCDDDFYEKDFFDKIFRATPKEDVIIVSMKRGDYGDCNGKPTHILPAAPQNISECWVGLEQLVVKGKVLKKLRLEINNPHADGKMIRELKESGIPIKYLMDTFVLFNYLEKGRYATCV
jgi:hypothetical protein